MSLLPLHMLLRNKSGIKWELKGLLIKIKLKVVASQNKKKIRSDRLNNHVETIQREKKWQLVYC